GQMPFLQNEGEHVADQEEVEKIEHIADASRGDDLPLIACQLLLLFQPLQHDARLPLANAGSGDAVSNAIKQRLLNLAGAESIASPPDRHHAWHRSRLPSCSKSGSGFRLPFVTTGFSSYMLYVIQICASVKHRVSTSQGRSIARPHP